MKLKLPTQLSVSDYHDFDFAKDILTQISSEFKVKEVAFFDGQYHGIIYVGKLTDKKNMNLILSLKEEQKYEDDEDNVY
jgi:hypothetical protein